MKLILHLSVFLSLVGSAFAIDLPKGVPAFLDQHCYDCHDDSIQKGGLNLLDQSFDLSKGSDFKVWQRVLERVRDGEMPPEKEPQPKPKEADTLVASLHGPLLEADLEVVAKEGRVVSRRLTRREYEHTMHDLLGIDIPLAEQLPEDQSSHGFETVASAQQLSHHNLARYLDVADQALAEAFDRVLKGDESYKEFHKPEALSKRSGGNYRGPEFRDGKSISWNMRTQFFGRMPVTRVPESGWYRIKVRGVHAINPNKQGVVWGTLHTGECYSNAPILYLAGVLEATKQPKDMVYEAWIREGHMLRIKPGDGEIKSAPSGATGGNVSFKGRNLAKDGHSGIAHSGIEVERIYPNATRKQVGYRLFGEKGLKAWADNRKAGVDYLVKRFARQAFRKPVTDAQVSLYQEIGKQSLKDGDSLAEALRASYRAILCSPRFLTLVEPIGQLDDHAIASRLSYTLWLSKPDAELDKWAREGKLTKPWALAKQVDRMLADPKAERFIVSFTDQWLRLKEIDFTSPDTRQFPTFDAVLQQAMLEETRSFIAELIKKDLEVTNFVKADFAMVNERLARHYRMNTPLKPGAGTQRVSIPSNKGARGGLVTHGSILKVTADGSSTSPVLRGVFVNERILGVHIPVPPPNIPAIEPDIRGAKSIRDQLAKHRESVSCFSCHAKIDPPGFVLEQFNPVGAWRKNYGINEKGIPVDPTGVTPDGVAFQGIQDWKRIYAQRDQQLARGFAEQFLTYSTGASIRYSDAQALDVIVKKASESDYGLRSIIQASLASPVFLNK